MKPSPKSCSWYFFSKVLLSPRVPSGNTISVSPAASKRRAFSGVPTTCPMRAKNGATNGRVGAHLSTMARQMRGGSASTSMEMPIISASKGSCPEWLAMSSARPAGTCSIPRVSTRNQFLYSQSAGATAALVNSRSRPKGSTPYSFCGATRRARRASRSLPPCCRVHFSIAPRRRPRSPFGRSGSNRTIAVDWLSTGARKAMVRGV